MDNLTHAALGLCAGLAARRAGAPILPAAVAALLAGELPDADLLIRSADDPLVAFRWHRHFTHSFFLWPVLAAIAAGVAAWFFRKRPASGFGALYPVALAAGLSHVLNDACTSYGTLVLWPFSDARVAWDCLPIIDIALTLPLVALAWFACKRASRAWALAGAGWFVAYAGMGRLQHDRAEAALLAELGGVRPTRLAVKPTVSNLVLWRGVWQDGDTWRTAAIWTAPFATPRITPGETRPAWSASDPDLPAEGTRARRLLEDFNRFTGGWNSVEDAPEGGRLIGDIRFATIPTRAAPLWGVHVRAAEPAHFEVRMDRRIHEGDWSRFGRLLMGLPPAGE